MLKKMIFVAALALGFVTSFKVGAAGDTAGGGAQNRLRLAGHHLRWGTLRTYGLLVGWAVLGTRHSSASIEVDRFRI